MRITFTNEECTRAILTRGFWWWRREAEVFQSQISDGGSLVEGEIFDPSREEP